MKKIYYLLIFIISFFSFMNFSFADGSINHIETGKVISILSEATEYSVVTDKEVLVQKMKVEVLSGKSVGDTIIFNNDYKRLKEGDIFYFNSSNKEGEYTVLEISRTVPLFILFFVFTVIVFLFAGFQGLRAILALIIGLLSIIFILLPLLLSGYSPITVGIFVSAVILAFAIFFTHGINKSSMIAYSSTIITVIITGILAFIFVKLLSLTGYASEESFFLEVSESVKIDFKGLMLAGIIIGSLGALDDISITQVSVIKELIILNNKLSVKELYQKAMRVGKDHIGALINTLVFAYAGASLPLMLLFYTSNNSFIYIINQEIFTTEIARAIIGSIGLTLAVPISTVLSIYIFRVTGITKKDIREKGHTCHHKH